MASAITIADGATVLFAGDSTSNSAPGALYAWYDPAVTGAFVQSVNAQFVPMARSWPASVSGVSATSTGMTALNNPVTPPGAINVINGGVNGDTTTGLMGRIGALMSTYSPGIVFIAVGTNDIADSISPATTQSNYAAILSTIQSYNSHVQVGCLSVYFKGEVWHNVPPPAWGVNSPDYESALAATNSAMQTSCNAAGALWIDTRDQFLPWEAANNPGMLGSGVASFDGTHLITAGKVAISPMVMSSVIVIP